MTVHNLKEPYVIYEGPPPPWLTASEPADAGQDEAASREADAERGAGSVFGIGLLVAGALAAGIAIGIWFAPSLRPADTVASLEPTAPLVTRLTEAPTPAPIEIPPVAAKPAPPEQLAVRTVPARSISKAPPKPRVAPPPKPKPIKTASTAKSASRSTRAADGCKTSGSRAQMTICADASIAAADQDMRRAYQRALRSGASAAALRAQQDDWLALREEAARRSPSDLAAAYEERIADLNAIADEPPH